MKFIEMVDSKFNKINSEEKHSHDDFYILKNEELIAVVSDDVFDAWSTIENMRVKWQNELDCKVEILTSYQYRKKTK